MKEYSYTCTSFKTDGEIIVRTETIDGIRLYEETGEVGDTAFMRLINNWNRVAMIGKMRGGPLSVYTYG